MRIFLPRLLQTFIVFCLAFGMIATAKGKDRIALVIGNGAYAELGALSNTTNDARSMGDKLTSLGYQTKLIVNADGREFRRELAQFAKQSERSEAAVLFYAGHGVQVGGENYLLPIDMEVPQTETDIKLSGIRVDDIVGAMRSDVRVVILDACRENPLITRSLSRARGSIVGAGLAAMRSVSVDVSNAGGVFIAYATEAGNVALDGDSRNSPFTEALLRHIGRPISIDDMFSFVIRDVRLATKNAQRPYKYVSIDSVFCLPSNCDGNLRQAEAATTTTTRPINAPPVYPSEKAESKNSRSIQHVSLAPLLRDGLQGAQAQNSAPVARIAQAPTQYWVMSGRSGDSSSTTEFFYDPSTIKTGSGRAWGTVKARTISEESRTPINSTAYEIGVRAFDCKSRTTVLTENSGFDVAGNKLWSRINGDARSMPMDTAVVPNSVNDSHLRIFCDPQYSEALVSAEAMKSDEWITIGGVESPDGRVSILPSSIEREEDSAVALIKTTFAKPVKRKEYDFSYFHQLMAIKINCKTGENLVLLYDFTDEVGKPYAKIISVNSGFQKPERNSPFYNAFDVVCNQLLAR